MQPVISNAQQALGRIQLTIERAAKHYPFHARVLARMVPTLDRSLGTMGVAVIGRAVVLYFNPDFVLHISLDQLLGVLLHEVYHVVFGHVYADPADMPDDWARVVAEEVTANEYIVEPLPSCVTLASFPQLPPHGSTRERYDRLALLKRRPAIHPAPSADRKCQGGVDGKDGRGSASRSGGDDPDGSGAARSSREAGTLVDDHEVRQRGAAGDGDRLEAAQAVRDLLDEASRECGGKAIPAEIVDALERLHGIGTTPGEASAKVDGEEAAKVPWQLLLRHHVGQALQPQPDLCWPSRRCPDLLGVVPGRRRRPGKPRIMAVIDTSDSMAESLLTSIGAELGSLSRQHDVVVVECDWVIQRVYRYRPITCVKGRGGTSLAPPFEPSFLAQHTPDLVIYFTDGFGDAPDTQPRVPVIWCLVPGGNVPTSWGQVVWLVEAVDS